MSQPRTIPWQADLLVLQARIRKARKVRRMTQAEAGALIGVSARTYRAWEAGAADLSATNLFLLAASLGIRVFTPDAGPGPNPGPGDQKRKDFAAFPCRSTPNPGGRAC